MTDLVSSHCLNTTPSTTSNTSSQLRHSTHAHIKATLSQPTAATLDVATTESSVLDTPPSVVIPSSGSQQPLSSSLQSSGLQQPKRSQPTSATLDVAPPTSSVLDTPSRVVILSSGPQQPLPSSLQSSGLQQPTWSQPTSATLDVAPTKASVLGTPLSVGMPSSGPQQPLQSSLQSSGLQQPKTSSLQSSGLQQPSLPPIDRQPPVTDQAKPKRLKPMEIATLCLIELWSGVASLSTALCAQGASLHAYCESNPLLNTLLSQAHPGAQSASLSEKGEWKFWSLPKSAVVWVLGGPSCTSLSTAGKQLAGDDPTSRYLFDHIKVLG